jgi:hypothetical protein
MPSVPRVLLGCSAQSVTQFRRPGCEAFTYGKLQTKKGAPRGGRARLIVRVAVGKSAIAVTPVRRVALVVN